MKMTKPMARAINEGTGYRKVSKAIAAMPIQRVVLNNSPNMLIAIRVQTIGTIGLH